MLSPETVKTLSELGQAKLATLRASLNVLVKGYSPEDLIIVLREALDDRALIYAQRTGDYDGAAEMRLAAKFLDGFEKFVDNYEPVSD